MAEPDIDISVVIPVMNEEEAAPDLAREVTEVMTATEHEWECVWIDDGSTDSTAQVIEAFAVEHPRHRLLVLDRNYGQSAALLAGFRHARGHVLATLDGDGQNDPHDLPQLLQRLSDGDVDLVNGIRQKRRDSFVRRYASKTANGFRNLLTRESVTDVGCAIRVMRRECVSDLPMFKGFHRFLPTLVRLKGFRITEIPVNHRPREKGKTKYGINNRLWVGLADLAAVCWMQRRLVWPKVKREVPQGNGSVTPNSPSPAK